MSSFVNLTTGVIETPGNKSVVEQYKKRPDLYKELEKSIIEKDITPKSKKCKKK